MNRIFIVEQDATLRNNIKDLLEAENYSIFEASNGVEAKMKINQYRPDLILSEALIPGIDGIQFLNYIRSSSELNNIAFIFLTGRPDYLDFRTSMNMGADDYFVKPFKSAELLQSIKMHLTKKKKFVKQINNLKQNVVRNIQHELRTPLVPILGYSEIISEEIDSLGKSEIKKLADNINLAGKKLNTIMDKLILYFDIKTLNPESKKELLAKNCLIYNKNVKLAIEDVIKNYPGKQIKTGLCFNQLQINCHYFFVIFKELLENALKHSADDSMVVITGSVFKENYHLSIQNRNPQRVIQHKDLNYPFYQDNIHYYTKDEMGIGLIIVKALVEFFDGEFYIYSTPDGYTRADIFLKITQNRAILEN